MNTNLLGLLLCTALKAAEKSDKPDYGGFFDMLDLLTTEVDEEFRVSGEPYTAPELPNPKAQTKLYAKNTRKDDYDDWWDDEEGDDEDKVDSNFAEKLSARFDAKKEVRVNDKPQDASDEDDDDWSDEEEEVDANNFAAKFANYLQNLAKSFGSKKEEQVAYKPQDTAVSKNEENEDDSWDDEDEKDDDVVKTKTNFAIYMQNFASRFDTKKDEVSVQDKPQGVVASVSKPAENDEDDDGWDDDGDVGVARSSFADHVQKTTPSVDIVKEESVPEEFDPTSYADILPFYITQGLIMADRRGRNLKHLKPYLDKYADLSQHLKEVIHMQKEDKVHLEDHSRALASHNRERIQNFEEWEKKERLLQAKPTGSELHDYDLEVERLKRLKRTKNPTLFEPKSDLVEQTSEELDATDKLKAKLKILEGFESSLGMVLEQMSEAIEEGLAESSDSAAWVQKSYLVQTPPVTRSVLARIQATPRELKNVAVNCDSLGPEDCQIYGSVVLGWSDTIASFAQYTQREYITLEGIDRSEFKITVPAAGDSEALVAPGLPVRKIRAINEIIFKQLLLACLFKHQTVLVDMTPFYELGLPSSVVETFYRDWAAKLNSLEFERHKFLRIVLCNDFSGGTDKNYSMPLKK